MKFLSINCLIIALLAGGFSVTSVWGKDLLEDAALDDIGASGEVPTSHSLIDLERQQLSDSDLDHLQASGETVIIMPFEVPSSGIGLIPPPKYGTQGAQNGSEFIPQRQWSPWWLRNGGLLSPHNR